MHPWAVWDTWKWLEWFELFEWFEWFVPGTQIQSEFTELSPLILFEIFKRQLGK